MPLDVEYYADDIITRLASTTPVSIELFSLLVTFYGGGEIIARLSFEITCYNFCIDFSSSPLFNVYFESEFTFLLVLFVTEVVDFLLLAVTPDFPPIPCADDSGAPLTILAFDPKTRLVMVFLDPDFQFELDGLAGLII